MQAETTGFFHLQPNVVITYYVCGNIQIHNHVLSTYAYIYHTPGSVIKAFDKV